MSLKQAIEALELAANRLDRIALDYAQESNYEAVEWADEARAALAALRSMPAEPVALQVFESYKAKVVMQAFQEGWAACRDSEYIGEEAENDAFNNSHALNHCLAYDMQHGHEATPHTEAVRMSEAEIDALFNEHHNPQETPWANWRRFARAVEQATAALLGVKMGDV